MPSCWGWNQFVLEAQRGLRWWGDLRQTPWSHMETLRRTYMPSGMHTCPYSACTHTCAHTHRRAHSHPGKLPWTLPLSSLLAGHWPIHCCLSTTAFADVTAALATGQLKIASLGPHYPSCAGKSPLRAVTCSSTQCWAGFWGWLWGPPICPGTQI